MHFEDGFPAAHVGAVEYHPAVEAARAQQRRVEDVGAVGGGHHDDVGVAVEAVHFHEQLVEGLLTLIVASAQPCAALATDGVDFVYEHNAGGMPLGLVEQVTHAARAHANEHFHEFRTGDGEEGHARFPGHGLRQQGFARPRRPDQQHPFGDARAEGEEFLGFLQKLHDFLQFFFGFVHTGDVVEGHHRAVAGEHARPRLPKGQCAAAPALALPHQVPEHGNHQDDGQNVHQAGENVGPDAGRLEIQFDAVGGEVGG